MRNSGREMRIRAAGRRLPHTGGRTNAGAGTAAGHAAGPGRRLHGPALPGRRGRAEPTGDQPDAWSLSRKLPQPCQRSISIQALTRPRSRWE
ncbi:hypothetical protein GCM10017589_48140 [Streptomyces poonensis]|nr:hypothetical protein GCM10017589_48140 [Streptomyces poonensis]